MNHQAFDKFRLAGQFTAFQKDEVTKWAAVVKSAGIKLDQ